MPRAMYEPGRYWGQVTHQRLGRSSTGNPQLVISFAVRGRVNPADPEGDLLEIPFEAERSVYRSITDKSIGYVTQDMDRLGWYGDSWDQFDEEHPQCVSIVGKELAFTCQHKPRQDGGELREEWSVAMSGGVKVNPLSDTETRKLNAMFGKALKGRTPPATDAQPKQADPPPAKAAKPPKEATPAATIPSDDIPF